MSHCMPDSDNASAVHTVAEAGTYIASVCFKHGPPTLTGIELEWLVHDRKEPSRRPDLKTLLAVLGPHAPQTLDPNSPAIALAAGGLVTVEPGGQLEISSAPATSVVDLISAMQRDVDELTGLLEPFGLNLSGRAADANRTPQRILHTPRYDAMAGAFDRFGPSGRAMMCSTAATQVCVDLGPADQANGRWRAAHELGPVLLAAFANSPQLAGAAARAQSSRMASWWQLDPERTLPPKSLDPADYVERALDTQVLARSRPAGSWQVLQPLTLREWAASGQDLTTADIDLHLSMIFPPVRPQGYLELRYLDAQPVGEWIAPLVLIAALFATPDAVAAVSRCCADSSQRWFEATEIGLTDPVLRACAAGLLEIAEPLVGALALPTELQVRVQQLLRRRLGEAISPATDDQSSSQPVQGAHR